jgi:hypothetical protein
MPFFRNDLPYDIDTPSHFLVFNRANKRSHLVSHGRKSRVTVAQKHPNDFLKKNGMSLIENTNTVTVTRRHGSAKSNHNVPALGILENHCNHGCLSGSAFCRERPSI